MSGNIEDIIVKLKTQSIDELNRQRVHHFKNRQLTSTDLYKLVDEEISRSENDKWTKLTFWVSLTTGGIALVSLILQVFK